MKHLLPILALVTFAGVCAFAGLEASGAPEPIVFHKHEPFHRLPVDEPTNDAPDDPKREHLAVYVQDVIGMWPSAKIQEVSEIQLSYDIAAAALEKPSSDPSQDAVLLAALAYFEGARFAEYVDSGECNDPEWRKHGFDVGPVHHPKGAPATLIWLADEQMHIGGDCDGSRAHTLWQIHPALDPSGPLYAACKLDVISTSRRDAAFCALSIAREDPSLGTYTGGQMAKAEERLTFARKAIADHPFRP
jgi:hypothetical protein